MSFTERRSFSWFVFCLLTGASVGISGFGLFVLAVIAGAQTLAGAVGR